MKVNELKDNSAVEEITLEIVDKGEVRKVSGGSLNVCNFTGKDDTGEVILALWNDDIEKISVGDKVKVTKGWSRTYNESLQVSTGRNGTIEIVK